MPKQSSKRTFRSLSPLALTLTLLLTLLTFTTYVDARCCCTYQDNRCADGKLVKGFCCGHGSCNIFCCNCDGGCLGMKNTQTHNGLSGDVEIAGAVQYQVCTAATGSSIFSGDEDCGAQLFHALDVEGTGKLSMGQYLSWYKGVGGAGAGAVEADVDDEEDEFMIGAREYFLRFDANGDGFIDMEEMHRAVGG